MKQEEKITGITDPERLVLCIMRNVVGVGRSTDAGAIGASFGFLIPRLARRWNLKPRVAPGPVTLALADAAALTCYFTLSSAVLR